MEGPYIIIRDVIRQSHYRAAPSWIIMGILKYQPLYNQLLFIDEISSGV